MGILKKNEEKQIVEDIADSGAGILFVAMSSPQKEIFVSKYKKLMNVLFVMAMGGSFEVI